MRGADFPVGGDGPTHLAATPRYGLRRRSIADWKVGATHSPTVPSRARAALPAFPDPGPRTVAPRPPAEALAAADEARAAARARGDAAGEARAEMARARSLEALQRVREAASAWEAAAAAWERAAEAPEQIAALTAAARLQAGLLPEAAAALIARAAAAGRADTRRPADTTEALSRAGSASLEAQQPVHARELWLAELALREQSPAGELETAATLHRLGALAFSQGDMARTQEHFERALAIRARLAPDTRDVALSYVYLGVAADRQGHRALAAEHFRRALVLQERQSPGSLGLAQTLHNLGVIAERDGDLAAAGGYHARALAVREKLAPDSLATAESLSHLAYIAYQQWKLPAAREGFQRALALREQRAPGTLDLAEALSNVGAVAAEQGDLAAAKEYDERALALRERIAPDSPVIALSLANLGTVLQRLGEVEAAEVCFRRELALREKQAPDGPEVANSLGRLGNLAFDRGDLAAAQADHERALALDERHPSRAAEVATSLINLGRVAWERGDLPRANRYLRQALSRVEQQDPASPKLAITLNNLALLLLAQGDATAARAYHQRALAIRERVLPESLPLAQTLNNLGVVAFTQEDVAAASEYHRRAFAIRERIAPASLDTAQSLHNLGALAERQGELDAARGYHERALAIRERVAPEALVVAWSLNNLGMLAQRQGDLAAAEGYHRRALAIRQRLAPVSLETAWSLDGLGEVARAREAWPTARHWHRQALEMRQRLAPGSPAVARTLHLLGKIAEKQRDWAGAARLGREAWALVRRQAAAVLGDEARQSYGAAKAEYAAALLRAQVARGERLPAFVTLEEGRAQAMQQLLRERRLDVSGAPPALRAAYQTAVAARDHAEQTVSEASIAEVAAQRRLAAALEGGATAAERERLRAAAESTRQRMQEAQSAYTTARLRADERWAAIRRTAPRAYPVVTPQQALRSLPPGTLFAAFSVSDEQTLLFLIYPRAPGRRRSPPRIAVFPCAGARAELQERIRAFRSLVTDSDAEAAASTAAGRALAVRLFPPAARQALAGARRLLLSPDGPLWEAPFAALVMNAHGPPRYLGEQLALTYTPSLTLFAQAQQDRVRPGRAPRAVVVGDPRFSPMPETLAEAPPAAPLRGARGLLLSRDNLPAPLPGTRAEAFAIARLYKGTALVGAQATEAALRQRLGGADMVHLATHGFLHPSRAMSSGVLLAAPATEPPAGATQNDGVLQAWEIYSQLKLRAELVVLSACETGRGATVAGEGIVGLTRALQYAGARSVVASQWQVSDASTQRLMVQFHERVRRGVPKDEALRQAMALVRRHAATAAPFHWAAFFLLGDPANPWFASRRR